MGALTQRKGRPKIGRMRRKKIIEGYLFIFPWLIGLSVFALFPTFFGLALGFFEWNVFTPPEFTGLDNFEKLFTRDWRFWKSVSVTLRYIFISVVLRVTLAFFVAMLLNQKIKGMGVWRMTFYAPSIVAGFALALLWSRMLDPEFGLVNVFLRSIGIEGPRWLGTENMAFWSITIMSLWSIGPLFVIFLAGLQGIPKELYEAAQIDGAGAVHRFIHIVIPLISPVLLFNTIIGLIQASQLFTEPFAMTRGGPNEATLTMMLYIWRSAFSHWEMGYAASIAVMLFVITIIFTIIVFIFFAGRIYYAGEGR